jgi:hypothetical protein
MSTASWFSLRHLTRAGSGTAAAPRANASLSVEVLEDRTLLSARPLLQASLLPEVPLREQAADQAPVAGPPRQGLHRNPPEKFAPVLIPAAPEQQGPTFLPALLSVRDLTVFTPATPGRFGPQATPAGAPNVVADSLPAAVAPVLLATPKNPAAPADVGSGQRLAVVAPPPAVDPGSLAELFAAAPADADAARAETLTGDEQLAPRAEDRAAAVAAEPPADATATPEARADATWAYLAAEASPTPPAAVEPEHGGELLPLLAALFVTSAVWHVCGTERKPAPAGPGRS